MTNGIQQRSKNFEEKATKSGLTESRDVGPFLVLVDDLFVPPPESGPPELTDPEDEEVAPRDLPTI